MKKLSIFCIMGFIIALMSAPVFGATVAGTYGVDVLEGGNSGGWSGSAKTWDTTVSLDPSINETMDVDFWGVNAPENMMAYGIKLQWTNTDLIECNSCQCYGSGELTGPWDMGGGITPDNIAGIVSASGIGKSPFPPPGTPVTPDGDGDIILIQCEFECQGEGDVVMSILEPAASCVIGEGARAYDPTPITFTVVQEIPPCTLAISPSGSTDINTGANQLFSAISGPSCVGSTYVWSDTCNQGSDSSTCSGNATCLFDAGVLTSEEFCTITVDDSANTNAEAGPVTASIHLIPGAGCEIEIYEGGSPVPPLNTYSSPGRRGLALTCGDTVQFDYCTTCDPAVPGQHTPCPTWSVTLISGTMPAGTNIDSAGLLTIGTTCNDDPVELEVTVLDTCNGFGPGYVSDSVQILVGEVTLDIGKVTTQPGSQGVVVDVELENPDHQVKAIQARIVDTPDDYLTCTGCVADPDNALEYSCVAQEQVDGDCVVVMTSNNPAAMLEQGSMRPIFSVEFDVGAVPLAVDCVDLWFYPPATFIADKFGCALCPCLISGEICFAVCGDVYPRECLPDDPLCGDGVVDIFDILEEIDFVLQIVTPSICQEERADVPIGQPPYCGCVGPDVCVVDGTINIFDVLVIIDMALGKPNCCDYCADGSIW